MAESKNNFNIQELENEEFFSFAFELECQWKKSIPNLTEKEKVEIFNPSKEMLLKNILILKKEYRKLKNKIKKDLAVIPKRDQWFYYIVFEKLKIPELLKIENQIFKLKRQLALAEGPTKKSFNRYENFQEMIAVAKSHSIIEMARDKLELKPSGKNFVALCPFHDDKKPSLIFFQDTNTFVCFGCGAKGDNLTFIMQLHGLSFPEAVRMLQ